MLALLPNLPAWMWILLATGAVIVGFSKTALPGATTITIAVFAAILPAKQSTGALLLLLMFGDLFALWTYRSDANWRTIARLAPAVVAGLALGGVFLALAPDAAVRRAIGILLLAVVTFSVWRRYASTRTATGRGASMGYGTLAGFSTMVANAGGPVMSMYFYAAKFPAREFLGTAAWFFAAINIAKLPVSISLGLVTPTSLILDLVLAPGVVLGAFIGRWLISRIAQRVFDLTVLAVTVLGALYLLL